jgi:uncharacterized protein YkwD
VSNLKWLLLFVVFAVVLAVTLGSSGEKAVAQSTTPTKFDTQTLTIINNYRAQRGLRKLQMRQNLFLLARQHSRYMAARRQLSHDGFYDRFRLSGFSSCTENVAWNYPTPSALVSAWRKSPGHNAALLRRDLVYAGVSKVGAYATYFACR